AGSDIRVRWSCMSAGEQINGTDRGRANDEIERCSAVEIGDGDRATEAGGHGSEDLSIVLTLCEIDAGTSQALTVDEVDHTPALEGTAEGEVDIAVAVEVCRGHRLAEAGSGFGAEDGRGAWIGGGGDLGGGHRHHVHPSRLRGGDAVGAGRAERE